LFGNRVEQRGASSRESSFREEITAVGQIEAIEGQPTREAQIASIYGEHAAAVRERCLRLTGSAIAADDLVQETFARFLARFRDLPDDLNVRGYLLVTARNIWANQLRQQGDTLRIEIDEGRTPDDRIENDPLRALLLAEQRDTVQRGAAGLSERQRRALTLRELGDRSYAEIGSELGLHTNAVAQVVWRARTQLRRSLRRSQIDVGVLPDDCRARLDVISDLVDETPSSDTAALKAHIEDCKDCRRTLSAFQEAGDRLRGVLPLVPLAAIATRVGTALRMGVGIPPGIGTTAAVTAAVVATAGGGGALMEHYGAVPNWRGTPHSHEVRTAGSTSSIASAQHVSLVVRRNAVRSQRPAGSNGSSIGGQHPRRTSPGRPVRAAVAVSSPIRKAAIPGASKPPSSGPTARPARADLIPPLTVGSHPPRPPEKVQKEKDAAPSPGTAQPADGKKTPPGQAKKTGTAAPPPPGQAQAAEPARTPPGQAKKAKDAMAPPSQSLPSTRKAKTPDRRGKAQSRAVQTAAEATAPDATTSTDTARKAHGPDGGTSVARADNTSLPASSRAKTPTTGASKTPVAPSAAPAPSGTNQPKSSGAETTPQQPPPTTITPPVSSPTGATSQPSLETPSPNGTPPVAPSNSSPGNGKGHGPK
jgi:RNA polymerase sigma factor (sigma-70 family)